VNNQSENNVYIQNIIIDGEKYSANYIDHLTLVNATDIVIVMGSDPNKSWGKIPPE
jgi:putative alpha-1,2-mannosidase